MIQTTILFTGGANFTFTGKIREDLDTGIWSFFETEEGEVHQFKKDSMTAILYGNLQKTVSSKNQELAA